MPDQIGYFASLKNVAGKVFSYLASITLTGTDGKTITVTQDTSLDEAVAMSSKLAIPGAWTTPAFDAGDFTASGSMTWTVAAGDVATYAYTIAGKVMTVAFQIITSSIGGTPSNQLLLKIPASKTASRGIFTIAYISDNGVIAAGVARVQSGYTGIIIELINAGNFSASTDATVVAGEITFEIN